MQDSRLQLTLECTNMSTPTLITQSVLGVGVEIYAVNLLVAIGSHLDEEDQEWLSAHLSGLPDYLSSPEGGKVMSAVVNCYRSHVQNKSRKKLE